MAVIEDQKADYAATIITVRAARDQARAESIRDLVDAHRRLQGSVRRFLARLGHAAAESASLAALADQLERCARKAGFSRMRELSDVIEAIRTAARERESLFCDSFDTDASVLRETVLKLERLDARLVGLCVEHVLHARGSIARGTSPN